LIGDPCQRKILKPSAVPCVFAWSKQPSVSELDRVERVARREQFKSAFETNQQLDQVQQQPSTSNDLAFEFGGEVEIHSEELHDVSGQPTHVFTQTDKAAELKDASTGTDGVAEPPMGVEKFVSDSRAVKYYTGLESHETFVCVLQSLGPAAYHLRYCYYQVFQLSVPNQLFLTLIKLRLNRTYFELSRMFDISESTAQNVFITWINFMALQWRELGIWGDKSVTDEHMPRNFRKKFPATRVIIDSLECKINKPQNPVAQQATWSSYKNDNTVKAVVGCSPGGLFVNILL